MIPAFRALFSFLTLLLFIETSQANEPRWRFSNPLPHGNNIVGLAYHDGLVWQAGDRGQVYTSSDFETWIPRESGTTSSLRSIAFFNGKVFISGENGTIVSGTSPHTLSPQQIGTSSWLEGIAASSSAIVAVGDAGAIYSSNDGSLWLRQGTFTTWLKSVAFGAGKFVCVGADGFMASSSNGVEWNVLPTGVTETLQKVVFVNDRFWVVGNKGVVFNTTLNTPITHLNIDITNNLFAVAASENELVVAGESAVYKRFLPQGSWISQADSSTPELAPLWPYYSALWDGRLFFLGGRTGMMVEGFRTASAAPLVWYSDVQPTRRWLWSLTATPQIYAAAGDEGTILTSQDGVEWDREVVPADALDEVLLGIGGTTNCLVAVGTTGTVLYSPNVTETVTGEDGQTIEVSLLGVYWNEATRPATTASFQGVAANASSYVVVGSAGSILQSSNGSNWVSRASPVSSYLSSVTAAPIGFVASGDLGKIITSPDGASWTPRNSGVSEWIYSVRHLNSIYLAVGENGRILTSPDSVNWTPRNSGTTLWLNDSAYVNGAWYIAANAGTVLTSTDSINWTAHRTISAKSLNAVAAREGQLIAAGLEGTILRANFNPPQSPVEILGYEVLDSLNIFLFQGELDQPFLLQSKSSLSDTWTTHSALELVHPDGSLIFETPVAGGSQRFFRTRLQD